MGETASTWKTPLHSSDTEHPEQKRREQHGHGRAVPDGGSGPAPMFQRGNKGPRAAKQPDSVQRG